jgi:radical SAM-linked protein
VSHQRIRIRHTKLGRTRYLSARDLTSVWERSLRRADLPIAYSEGFSPHAKVSFPDALPVGLSSTGEYAELAFAAPIEPGPGLGRLSATLPEGMEITTYLEVPDGASKLAKMLGATMWELAWPVADIAEAEALRELAAPALAALLAADGHDVVKRRPSGDKVVDIRPPIVAAELSISDTPTWRDAAMPHASTQTSTSGAADHVALILRTVLRNGGATVRPIDLAGALASLAPAGTEPLPATRHACRVAQGAVVDAGVKEALTGQVVGLVAPVSAGAA